MEAAYIHDPKKVLRARFPLPVAAPVTLRASQPSEGTILVNLSAYDATAAPGPDLQTVCNASVFARRLRGHGLASLQKLSYLDHLSPQRVARGLSRPLLSAARDDRHAPL